MKFKAVILTFIFLAAISCESLDTENLNNPNTQKVLASGTDLNSVLSGGYISFWQGIHDVHPVMALSITSDQYGVSWGNFAGRRMGEEPRQAYNNRSAEADDYKKMINDPWFGALSSISTANDVIGALQGGTTIDDGGDRDKTIEASSLFLRGVSMGYLALLFDKGFRATEDTDLSQQLDFISYQDMLTAALADLDAGIAVASTAGEGFNHNYFNGVSMDPAMFIQLSNSYAARFLASWPRTESEAAGIDWGAVKTRAQAGVDWNFAPQADGNFWFGAQRYQYEDTGNGGFWARVDQRLVAALDPSQPTRYPEVIAKGEAPLASPEATSDDARLLSDFTFDPEVDFPTDRGEWHFSHYKHSRNETEPSYAGNATSAGPMPTFVVAENEMLLAEAELNTGGKAAAIGIINAGARVTRGGLAPLPADASDADVNRAIMYEKSIELIGTAPFMLWLERRRRGSRLDHLQVDDLGGLQLGTPAQLPVPDDELGVREETPYNFGGINTDPEGINAF